MRKYSDRTLQKKIRELIDPIVDTIKEMNPEVSIYTSSRLSMTNYNVSLHICGHRLVDHSFFWKDIVRSPSYQDLYEALVNKKDLAEYVKEFYLSIESE